MANYIIYAIIGLVVILYFLYLFWVFRTRKKLKKLKEEYEPRNDKGLKPGNRPTDEGGDGEVVDRIPTEQPIPHNPNEPEGRGILQNAEVIPTVENSGQPREIASNPAQSS